MGRAEITKVKHSEFQEEILQLIHNAVRYGGARVGMLIRVDNLVEITTYDPILIFKAQGIM